MNLFQILIDQLYIDFWWYDVIWPNNRVVNKHQRNVAGIPIFYKVEIYKI